MLRAALALALLAAACGRSAAAEAPGLCRGTDARIVVATAAHRLVLCARDRQVGSYPVRLGRGGVGKVSEGDGKTPLGTYPLGAPRPSSKYGTFIPIGYPTADQRRRGYTGGDVGVHGPPRWARWLGSLVNTFDSSDGCVGLASDAEMTAISGWVTSAGARVIELR